MGVCRGRRAATPFQGSATYGGLRRSVHTAKLSKPRDHWSLDDTSKLCSPSGPTGPAGPSGLGIGGTTVVNGTLVITLTNGTTVEVPLPPGEEPQPADPALIRATGGLRRRELPCTALH